MREKKNLGKATTVTANMSRYECISDTGVEITFRIQTEEDFDECDTAEDVLRDFARLINVCGKDIIFDILENIKAFSKTHRDKWIQKEVEEADKCKLCCDETCEVCYGCKPEK